MMAAAETRRATLPGGDVVTFDDSIGRVRETNGRHGVCELGLAIRLGIADPTPEMAAAVYPLFELCPGEERADPGEVFETLPVFAWVPQDAAAVLVGLTTRQVQNLERKGLPNRGRRDTKRYPLPHLVMWMRAYYGRGGADGKVRRLPFRVALAWNRLQEAELDLKAAEGRL
jgi:hypothetical protein